MRRFIFGILMLMAVPAYTVAQQRDRSGSSTGRTAVPREQGVQAAPTGQTDRRAESRGRRRDEHPQATPARALNPGFRNASLNPDFLSPLNPGFLSPLNPGFRSVPDREQWRPGHRGDYQPPYRRPYSGSNFVFVPYAVPVVIEREIVDEAAGAPVIVEQPSLARLILDIHPPTAQVFADGYYIGLPEDFRFEDGGAVLEPGPHRIDILERDYEPVSFDVNLTRGQSATFRRMLTPTLRAPQPASDDAAKAPPVAKQPATFYLIPGCYIGNVPPNEANLPASCDIARAVSFRY